MIVDPVMCNMKQIAPAPVGWFAEIEDGHGGIEHVPVIAWVLLDCSDGEPRVDGLLPSKHGTTDLAYPLEEFLQFVWRPDLANSSWEPK